MKAIIYKSNSGFTKKYAEILSEKSGIPAYDINEGMKIVSAGSEIIYMGWLMAGKISGYKKAKAKFNVKCVCAVGMAAFTEKYQQETKEWNAVKDSEFFYLQGGFDINKLHGMHKFMMKTMIKSMKPKIEKKEEKTLEDLELLEMAEKGKDCVSEENLKGVLEWLKK